VDLCGMATAPADMFSLTVQATEHPLRVNRDSARALVLAIPDRLAGDATAGANDKRQANDRIARLGFHHAGDFVSSRCERP
jgi:hypothetical protein